MKYNFQRSVRSAIFIAIVGLLKILREEKYGGACLLA
jgi:hypothetical protein